MRVYTRLVVCAYTLNNSKSRWLMYSKIKFNLRKFFISLLSALLAVMLVFSVACNKDVPPTTNDNDDSTSTETTDDKILDYQSIKNGDFEFGTDEKTSYPASTPSNWSNNNLGPSTTGASGVIDTKDTAYDKIKDSQKLPANPYTPYAYGLVKSEYDYEDEDKRVNPQADGSKILMINNIKDNNGEGAARYYKASSSISLPVAEYAVLSFWVKTVDLYSIYTSTPGAYVRLTSSTGSNTYDEIVLKDIDTKGEWAKFEIYFEGSELASSTIGFNFGLGRGNKVDHNEYVEGYAFLDNVNVKALEKDEFPTDFADFKFTIANPNEIEEESFAGVEYLANGTANDDVKGEFTTYKAFVNYNGAVAPTANVTKDVIDNAIKYNENGKAGYDYATGNTITAVTEEVDGVKTNSINMNFANYSSATFTTDNYELAKESYNLVSFLVKTESKNATADKLKVQVVNGEKEVDLFTNIDTTGLESARYGDYIMYRAFINNPTPDATNYSIKITYGYDKVWQTAFALQQGFVDIKDFKVEEVGEDYYKLASANQYIVKQQIYGNYLSFGEESETPNDDIYAVIVDKTQAFSVKEKPATNVSGYTFKTTDAKNTNYGIVNSEYYKGENHYGEYIEDENGGHYTHDFASNVTGFDKLNATGNDHAQVLVLDNKTKTYSRFISTVNTVTAGSTSKVIVKVKAYEEAEAKVSIVDASIVSNDYAVKNFELNNEKFELSSKVTSSSYVKGGWTYVYFYITAGNEDIEFRVQISNGTATTPSIGTVFTEGAVVTSLEPELISTEKRALSTDFGGTFVSKTHTRAPSTVKTTNENGEVVETTQYYQPTEVYFANDYAKFVNYSTLFASDVIDNTVSTETPETPETEQAPEQGYTLSPNVALQVSSIIIAIILIIVILVILIRQMVKKRNRRKEKSASYYEEKSGFDRNTREKTLKKIAEKKAKESKKVIDVELSDDDDEYDYSLTEIMDEDVEEDEELEENEIVDEDITEAEEIVEESSEEEKSE